MKSSDTKGFWGSVTVTHPLVTDKAHVLESHIPSHIENQPLLDAYKSVIQYTRNQYLRVPTKSGRPSKGPRYLCVTKCTEENELGITGSHITKAKRWVCKTCLGLCVPVWSDGPTPDREEMEQDYADYMANRKMRRF